MTIQALAQLQPALLLIPAADVIAPGAPVADVQTLAQHLARRIGEGSLGQSLSRLRLPADIADQLKLAAFALAEAQAAFRNPPANVMNPENNRFAEQAEEAFRDLRATVIFLSGGNKAIRRSITEATADGNDRVAAFFQLASAFELARHLVRPSDEIDPDAKAAECREWGRRLMEEDAATSRSGAIVDRDLRDRAYTHLDNLIDEVRAAAAYHFRHDRAAYSAFMVPR